MTWPARYVYVAAIEGLDELLTSGDTTAVTTAWSATDWTSATGGLFVDLKQEQRAHPWEPFQAGGALTLSIADDNIGVVMHRTAGGAESELVTGVDRNDTTIEVLDTSAFPATGTIHCGTEAMSYSAKTGTAFTVTRGMYSPFGCDSSGSGGSRFGQNHRVGAPDYAPPIAPSVTQYPREWIGRWVGLWVHGYNADGTLQTKANALLAFAGRISEVRDDPETLSTVIVVDHVLTDLKDAAVGRDFFTGEVTDGIYLQAGIAFSMQDWNGVSLKTANDLTVVASGATAPNEINAGTYTHDELFTALNTWWASENTNSRLHGTYHILIVQTSGTLESSRCKIGWYIPGSVQDAYYTFTLPKAVAIFLGMVDEPINVPGYNEISETKSAGSHHSTTGVAVPYRTWITNSVTIGNMVLTLENVGGSFQDQYATLPTGGIAGQLKPVSDGGLEWGVFCLDDQIMFRAAAADNGDGTWGLTKIVTASSWFAGGNDQTLEAIRGYSKRLDDPTPIKVRQVFWFDMPCADFIKRVCYGSGVSGYNSGTFDDLPYGVCMGIPGGLLGTAFETSVDNMPGADKPIGVILGKPTKLSKLLGSDLTLRHSFPVWKSGGLRMATWQSPVASLATAALTEANKAEPSGRDATQRSSTLLSDRWAKPLIKIAYNRDAVDSGGGDYRSTINIEDRTAIDDAGDRGEPFTIEARNTYFQLLGTGTGIEDIVPNSFLPGLRYFTKPMYTLRRSISRDLWEALALGDVVTTSDEFARDPATGLRILSSRPGIVIRHTYSPGGLWPAGGDAPPTNQPMVGEVELMFVATNRVYAYSPSAEVASYTSGTKTITCTAHAYSESSESADASNFAAGDAIRIIEIDPADPAAPQTWTDTVVSVSGNDVVLTTGLAGYSASKSYRIIPDTYSTVQASQQDKAFQADDANGLIESSAQSYMFGVTTSSITGTAYAHTDLPERHSSLTFGDGKPYDVGSIVGLSRLVENYWDHKSAICSPVLSSTVVGNSTYSTGFGYKLVMMAPVFLTSAGLSNSVVRYLNVSPWLRSTDGTSTRIRVSLCPIIYKGNTLEDIDRGSIYSDHEWTTTSTTWATGAAVTLTCNVKTNTGRAWLLVEANYKAETRGLAEVLELQRTIF